MSDLLLKATPSLLDGWAGPAYIGEGEERAAVVVVGVNRAPGMGLVICYIEPYRRIEPDDVGFAFAEELWLDLNRDEVYDRVLRVLTAACWPSMDVHTRVTGFTWEPMGRGRWSLGGFIFFVPEAKGPNEFAVPGLDQLEPVGLYETRQQRLESLLHIANHVLHGEVTHG